MERKKKLHNPEITEEDWKKAGIVKEDLAVKAFDRNNDAVSLEDQVKIEKGDTSFRREFIQLVSKHFGDDLHYLWQTGYGRSHRQFSKIYQDFQNFEVFSEIDLRRKMIKGNWLMKPKFEDYIKIELTKTRETENGETTVRLLPIFGNGTYNPIKIRAYTPKALKQAKDFAKAYKKLTGQEVTLIQECADEEPESTPQKDSSNVTVDDLVLKEFCENNKTTDEIKQLDKFRWTLITGLGHGAIPIFYALTAINQVEKGKYGYAALYGLCTVVWGWLARSWYKKETSKYEDFLKKIKD